RIVYQIHERVPDGRGVSRSMDADRSSKRKFLLFFVGEHAELINDISRQSSKVQVLWSQQYFSRVGARVDQKALDEPGRPVYLLQHAADDVAISASVKWVLQRHFPHAAHRGEWGA